MDNVLNRALFGGGNAKLLWSSSKWIPGHWTLWGIPAGWSNLTASPPLALNLVTMVQKQDAIHSETCRKRRGLEPRNPRAAPHHLPALRGPVRSTRRERSSCNSTDYEATCSATTS